MNMKIALAQINSHVGHFDLNADKILKFSAQAKDLGADIIAFPEASLFGYHPMDLLERPTVVQAQMKALNHVCRRLPKNILVLFGAFTLNQRPFGKPYFNSAVAVYNGKVRLFNKTLLPTYDVFDDARHIEPGNVTKNIIRFKGKKILITICEDIWAWPTPAQKRTDKNRTSLYDENPLQKIPRGSVDLVLNLSASPFFQNKWPHRLAMTQATARYFKAPMVYVNMVGGQDELIFDGGSFALNEKGSVIAHSPHFCENLQVVDLNSVTAPGRPKFAKKSTALQDTESLHAALVLGIHDFITKIGLRHAHLGLSGGIDSAVVACLAADALGSKNVTAIALPGPYSAPESLSLSKTLAQNLGLEFKVIDVNKEYALISDALKTKLAITEFGTVHENLQARIRGMLLMAFANAENSLLLNTTNKSEMAAGYGTLYGDMCGGLSVIGDLLKRNVYQLARYYNREREIIPQQIIDRPPSAELRPQQRDTDTLPPYDELDDSVVRLVEKSLAARSPADRFLLKALMRNEFKRWQSPPILKVRAHSFGQGRRMPIANFAVF